MCVCIFLLIFSYHLLLVVTGFLMYCFFLVKVTFSNFSNHGYTTGTRFDSLVYGPLFFLWHLVNNYSMFGFWCLPECVLILVHLSPPCMHLPLIAGFFLTKYRSPILFIRYVVIWLYMLNFPMKKMHTNAKRFSILP